MKRKAPKEPKSTTPVKKKKTELNSNSPTSSTIKLPSTTTIVKKKITTAGISKKKNQNVDQFIKHLLNEGHETGITQETIQRELPFDVSPETLVESINRLIAQGFIEICKVQNGKKDEFVYRKPSKKSSLPKGSSHEDNMIYQFIEQSGIAGISMVELKNKTGLPTETIKASLNSSLASLVKSVRHVTGKTFLLSKKRLVYLLASIVPSDEITGGVFFADGKLDVAFINRIQFLLTQKFLPDQEYLTADQICSKINNSGALKIELKLSDMIKLLDCLTFDNKVEKIIPETPFKTEPIPAYRAIKPHLENSFTDIPCSICPVFDRCREGGEISPSNCQYLSKWALEF